MYLYIYLTVQSFHCDLFVSVQTKVVEKFFSGHQLSADSTKLIHQSLQHGMGYARAELFKILHTILVNGQSRDLALSYIAKALERNAKKSQIQVSLEQQCT